MENEKTLKYVLYIGLFDKDTKKQEIKTEVAKETIKRILLKQGISGMTIPKTADGVYSHENGEIVQEPSVMVELLFVERIQIVRAMDELKVALNQETIAVQVQVLEDCFLY